MTLPLANLSFPSNAQIVSEIFMSLANFDIIPHETINNWVFEFAQDNAVRETRFDLMGYGTTNFILNSGTGFWFIAGWCFLVFVTLALSPFKFGGRMGKVFGKLNTIVFFGLILRLYLECYLELMVCAQLNLSRMLWSHSGESISSAMAIGTLVALAISPLFLLHFFHSKHTEIHHS